MEARGTLPTFHPLEFDDLRASVHRSLLARSMRGVCVEQWGASWVPVRISRKVRAVRRMGAGPTPPPTDDAPGIVPTARTCSAGSIERAHKKGREPAVGGRHPTGLPAISVCYSLDVPRMGGGTHLWWPPVRGRRRGHDARRRRPLPRGPGARSCRRCSLYASRPSARSGRACRRFRGCSRRRR